MARFQSSEAKDLVRERYDLPLVQAVHRRKRGPIRYFGLPGEQALDLESWGHLCEYVNAVELFPDSFRRLRHVLNIEYGHLRHRAHLGDVDHVILMNKGRDPSDRICFDELSKRRGIHLGLRCHLSGLLRKVSAL